MERGIRATKREIEAQKAIGGDTTELRAKLKKQKADYYAFSEKVGIRPKDNRLRVISGTSDLKKTKTIKWIEDVYKGYTATIPKTWQKTVIEGEEIIRGTNPKFVLNPPLYDKQAVLYNTNCVNSTVAYEMRCRGYKVTAGKSNSKLREKPSLAWEEVFEYSYEKVAFDEIEKQMQEWGNGARACVCFKNTNNQKGHAIVAENMDGNIVFLDVQSGRYYNKIEVERANYNHTLFFRTDDAIISNRGVNACEKE